MPPETTPASVRVATHNSIGSNGIGYEVRYQVMGAKPARLAERGVRAPGAAKASGGVLSLREVTRRDSHFVCQGCGHVALAWTGRCPGLRRVEHPGRDAPAASRGPARASRLAATRPAGRPARRARSRCARSRRRPSIGCSPGSPSSTGCSAAGSSRARWSCSAARPGIGKSTLTGMALGNLCAAGQQRPLRLRRGVGRPGAAARRAARRATRWRCRSLAETSVEAVLATLEAERPDACVIDSIQTLHAEGMTGAPGSVGQVREAAGGDHGGGQAARHAP